MRKKKVFFIVMGIFFGIAITSTISYVIAATLINSKDVIYQDNSNLAADNVQEAIDGTCSKIDTRLSEIEDKLYTIKEINGEKNFVSTTNISYTGVYIDLPTNSYCSITVVGVYMNAIAIFLDLNSSSTVVSSGMYNGAYQPLDSAVHNHLSVNYNFYTRGVSRYYVWAAYANASENRIQYSGFCATKYN